MNKNELINLEIWLYKNIPYYEYKTCDVPTRSSLSQDDLPRGTEVLTGLRGSSVLTCLEADDSFSGPQLFFGEFSFVLFRWTGT